MIGFAIFTKTPDNRIQGICSVYSNKHRGMQVINCYTHRDSNIGEGIVVLDTADKYIIKEKEDGTQYAFIKGKNDTTSDISAIEPINIKRAQFEATLAYGQGMPVFNSNYVNQYKVGNSIIYASGHTLYAIVDGKMYILGNNYQLIEKHTKRYESMGGHSFTDEQAAAFRILNRLIQSTGEKITDTTKLNEDIDSINLYTPWLTFSGAGNSVWDNELLMNWFKQRKTDCLPFGIDSGLVYGICATEEWGRVEIRNNKELAFNQLLTLDGIFEKRVKQLCERMQTRIRDKKALQHALCNCESYFCGSKALAEFRRSIG